jgi:carboxypeptidase A4
MRHLLTSSAAVSDTWFDSYHSYADHLQFWEDLQAKFPDQSEIVTSGQSTQGENITGIHLWGSSGKGNKPAIVIHGTVHAREWISTMTVEFIAYSLLSNYSSDADTKSYVDAYDFHIFPVVNPDGFKYTQTSTRLWRKNRQTNSGSSCVGTDINRNWNAGWSTGGSSTDPCAEDYRGPSATSAPETKGLSSYLSSLASTSGVQMYTDFHSYSQLWMTPYGYSCSKQPSNAAQQNALAADAGDAIEAVFGTQYETGPICPTIYQASGSSVDWAVDVAGATYAFAVELRDTGRYGFVLPANQIRPTAQETFAGLEAVLKGM